MVGLKTLLPRALIIGLAFAGTHSVLAADSSRQFVVAGWDTARAGDGAFETGDFFDTARALISTNFPGATLTSVNALSDTALANVDLLVLPTGVANGNPITPLTQAEQDALFDFVSAGGAALIMPDNDSFGTGGGSTIPDPATIAANASLIDPFGMAVTGTLPQFASAVITAPTHPVMDGPAGIVTSVSQVFPGMITNPGPFANTLAEQPGFGVTMAEIPEDAISAGSGPVLVISDFNTIVDAGLDGAIDLDDNATMFVNAIAWLCPDQDNGPPDPNETIEVEIDILPSSVSNVLKLRSHRGKLPVLIFSNPDLDPCDLDLDTVELAGSTVVRHRWKKKRRHLAFKISDMNHDGVRELLVLFWVSGLDPDQIVDDVATLTGQTVDGDDVEGSDRLVLKRPSHAPKHFHKRWPLHWHKYWKHHFPDWKKHNKHWWKYEF